MHQREEQPSGALFPFPDHEVQFVRRERLGCEPLQSPCFAHGRPAPTEGNPDLIHRNLCKRLAEKGGRKSSQTGIRLAGRRLPVGQGEWRPQARRRL